MTDGPDDATTGRDEAGTAYNLPGLADQPSLAVPGGPGEQRSSRFSRDSAARIFANGVTLVAGFFAGIIAARSFGPSGKGIYSTLALLVDLAGGAACLGLAEAACFLIGRRLPSQTVLSTTLGASLISSLLMAAAFVVAAFLSIRQPGLLGSAAAGALTIPAVAVADTLAGVMNANDRFAATSLGSALGPVTTALAMAALVGIGHLGVTGGMLAGTLGALAVMGLFCAQITRMGLSLRPRIGGTTRQAVRFGAATQAALLLRSATARFDLLLVYWLLNQAAAGQYSIGLTLSLVVASVPSAVSYAAFPRLSRLRGDEAHQLLVRSTRVASLAATLSAVVIAASAPLAIPLLYGSAYRPAVVPTMLLTLGGVVFGLQWSIARGYAAQGHPRRLLLSFLVSTTGMVLGDLLLIPSFGLVGAAVAAAVGPAAGLAVALVAGDGQPRVRAYELVPRSEDVRAVLQLVHQFRVRR